MAKGSLLAVLLIGWSGVFLQAAESHRPMLVLNAGGHTSPVKKVFFLPDGKELITVSKDKTIRLWDAATGEPLRTLRPPAGPGDKGKLYAAAISPDGRMLAVGGYTRIDRRRDLWGAYLIALPSGKLLRGLKGHSDVVFDLAFSPDGRRIVSGSGDDTARVWDVASGVCEQVLEGHTGFVDGVAFSPNAERVATASYDKTVRVWSAASGKLLRVLRGHTDFVRCLAYRGDARLLATGGHDHSIRFWDVDGKPLRPLDSLGERNILALQFSPDFQTLLFTQGSGTGPQICGLVDPVTGRVVQQFQQHNGTIIDGTVSRDGKLCATTGGNRHETFVWQTADGRETCRLVSRGNTCTSAAWAPDGLAIAWGHTNLGRSRAAKNPLERLFHLNRLTEENLTGDNYLRQRYKRGSIELAYGGRDTVLVHRPGVRTVTLKMPDVDNHVRCMTLLPGERVAVGTSIGLFLFDTTTGKRIRKLQGHTNVVWAVSPSPDGRYLLSASGDQTLRIWDPNRADPLLSLFFAGEDWVAWTGEGYYACSPGGERLMGWHIDRGPEEMADFYPAAYFRKTYFRPDVIQRVLHTGSVSRALAEADKARGQASEQARIEDVLPPLVSIVSPLGPTVKTDAQSIEIRAVAKAAGNSSIKTMQLLLDGRPYEGRRGEKAIVRERAARGQVEESWTVGLAPGTSQIAVRVATASSYAVSPAVEVTYAPEKHRLPTLHVLAIGVSDYPDERVKLRFAAKDARAMAATFAAHSKKLFADVKTAVIADKDATRAGILRSLSELKKSMTQRDMAVIYFSGHGVKDNDGVFYLYPVDGDADQLEITAVAEHSVKKYCQSLPGRLVVMLDACHAGQAGALVRGGRKKITGVTDDLVRDLVTEDYGVIVMASSMGGESSLEHEAWGHGAFTKALTEGLAGKADKNADGVVYFHELDSYVTDRVKQLTDGRQHPVTGKPTTIRSFPLARP